jgi:hypothetical protein
MTAPNGAIKFNNSTGSDTQSSGLGPAVAVNGSGASTTGASAVVTGISTTGVSAGDLLWVQSSSGRQFSIIASVDSSTQVTCDDNFDNTESGRTWAIGGKRDSLDGSSQIWADAQDGWETNFEYTGSNYTTASTITLRRYVILKGVGASRPIIEQTNNVHSFTAAVRVNHYFINLQFINSNGTKTSSYFFNCGDQGPNASLLDCYVGSSDSSKSFTRFISKGGLTNVGITAKNTIFDGAAERGTFNNGALHLAFYDCVLKNCGSHGYHSSHNNQTINFFNTQIKNNNGDGIRFNTISMSPGNRMFNCIINNNTGHGLNATGASDLGPVLYNNILSNNGGYAITLNSVPTKEMLLQRNNVFYNNTSGSTNNITLDSSNVTLTADPFVDAANGDFNLNNAAGGGAVLRSTSYTLGG